MSHREEYKGHQITVDTYRLGKGFRWSYQIDGGDIRDCRDRPLRSEQAVLSEGISEAKAEIDRQPPGVRPPGTHRHEQATLVAATALASLLAGAAIDHVASHFAAGACEASRRSGDKQ
jgi:hypothetical protein